MRHAAAVVLLAIATWLTGPGCSAQRPDDPFVGYFTDAKGAALELTPGDAPGTYGGYIYGDAKLPIRLRRDGDLLRGSYGYPDQSFVNPHNPVEVRNTPEGLVVIDGGDRYLNALAWYPSEAAFERTPEGRRR